MNPRLLHRQRFRGGTTLAWPSSAAQMASVMGWGTWASGWNLNEAAAPFADSFGANTLSLVGTAPLYQQAGPLPGDFAVAFQPGSGDLRLAASSTFNITTTGQVAFYACIKSTETGAHYIILKGSTVYYSLVITATNVRVEVSDGTTTTSATVSSDHSDGVWRDFLMTIDRDTDNAIRLHTDRGSTASTSIAALGTLSNASILQIGDPSGARSDVAFWAIANAGVKNLADNGATAIANIRAFTGRT